MNEYEYDCEKEWINTWMWIWIRIWIMNMNNLIKMNINMNNTDMYKLNHTILTISNLTAQIP